MPTTMFVHSCTSCDVTGTTNTIQLLQRIIYEQNPFQQQNSLYLIGMAMVAYYAEYYLNFSFVGAVSNATFSVSDIGRGVAVIVTGAFMFNKVLKAMNWVGSQSPSVRGCGTLI